MALPNQEARIKVDMMPRLLYLHNLAASMGSRLPLALAMAEAHLSDPAKASKKSPDVKAA